MSDRHDDIVLWSERQAELLRQHAAIESATDAIDWPHVIEEIEAVGGSERAALTSRIGSVIEHLLKIDASPEAGRAGWRETIIRAQSEIAGQLEDTPSLRTKVDSMIATQLPRQRRLVAEVLTLYGEAPTVSLDDLSYTRDQVLGSWLPGDTP